MKSVDKGLKMKSSQMKTLEEGWLGRFVYSVSKPCYNGRQRLQSAALIRTQAVSCRRPIRLFPTTTKTRPHQDETRPDETVPPRQLSYVSLAQYNETANVGESSDVTAHSLANRQSTWRKLVDNLCFIAELFVNIYKQNKLRHK